MNCQTLYIIGLIFHNFQSFPISDLQVHDLQAEFRVCGGHCRPFERQPQDGLPGNFFVFHFIASATW